MTRYITLRKIGGSLHMHVPMEFVRTFGLRAGDSVLWAAEGDGTTLKFFNVTTSSAPAEKQDEEATVAAE